MLLGQVSHTDDTKRNDTGREKTPTLIAGRAIQHAKDLEDVAVAVIAAELVAGAVEAQHQLPWLSARVSRPWRVHVDEALRPMGDVVEAELATRLRPAARP